MTPGYATRSPLILSEFQEELLLSETAEITNLNGKDNQLPLWI